jgi:glycosyltransferase involved in cell wall biosynthesis
MKIASPVKSWKPESDGAAAKAAVKPKICILTETYYPHVGGGETQAQSLAEELASKGFSVTVITRYTARKLKKFEHINHIPVYRIPPFGKEHYKKWGLLVTAFPALLRLAICYDVILVSGFRILGLPAVLAGKLLNKKCILKADNNGEMSGEYFKGGLAKVGLRPQSAGFRMYLGLRNRILRFADGYVAISADIKRELQYYGAAASHKIYPIPNSVNADLFCPVNEQEKKALRCRLNLPDGDPLAAFSGRLVSYKGLPLLLNVWKELIRKHPRAVLLLVGPGSMDIYNCERELKDFSERYNLAGQVIFTGEVRNVHEYLKASDLFVFPTMKEAFGISLIEAMSCGLPVVTTPVGGLKDIVQHCANGLVVEPGDERRLFQALDRLMSDPELRDQLGKAGRQTVLERYSTEIVTGQYIEVFNHVYHSKS